MTDEEWKAWEIGRASAMMNAAPKPSLERRLGRLEADVAAQRTAILKLERAVFIHSCSVAIQGAAITWLIWKVLT
jgi:hypothetical protein